MAVSLSKILKIPDWVHRHIARQHSMLKDSCRVPCLTCEHACRNHDGGLACDVEGCKCEKYKGDPGELA